MTRQIPIPLDDPCPCGSELTYQQCCQSILAGTKKAATAEALMRSRYTAHVIVDVPYLMSTWAPEMRAKVSQTQIQHWAEESTWLGLKICQHQQTQIDQAIVEFIARYRDQAGALQQHHEISRFRREQGQWLFIDGHQPPPPGRNSPCPCGSGKKFKRCCSQ